MDLSLREFLISSYNESHEVEVVVSKRLSAVKFTVKPMSSDEHAMLLAKNRDSKDSVDLQQAKIAMIVDNCLKPSFRDASFLSSINANTPEQGVKNLLFAGEIIRLADEIGRISGFSEDLDKLEALVKESKNS